MMTTRLKCCPSEMQGKQNFWEGQSVPNTWKLKIIMSAVWGYAYTEKWTQVAAALQGTHELAKLWCKQLLCWRCPVVKCPCAQWCIVDLSPWIISLLLLWRRELWEGTERLSTLEHLLFKEGCDSRTRSQPSPLAKPTNVQPKLCHQAGGPVRKQGWDGANKKLQLVASPAWGYHKAPSTAGSGSWSLLPPSSCRGTIITAQLEVGLLLQPGQKLAWCTPCACVWLGCIMQTISANYHLTSYTGTLWFRLCLANGRESAWSCQLAEGASCAPVDGSSCSKASTAKASCSAQCLQGSYLMIIFKARAQGSSLRQGPTGVYPA